MKPLDARRVSWWRLGLGLVLVAGGLKNLDTGDIPPELEPSNMTQWFGFHLVTALFLIFGLGLVIAGLLRARRDHQQG